MAMNMSRSVNYDNHPGNMTKVIVLKDLRINEYLSCPIQEENKIFFLHPARNLMTGKNQRLSEAKDHCDLIVHVTAYYVLMTYGGRRIAGCCMP